MNLECFVIKAVHKGYTTAYEELDDIFCVVIDSLCSALEKNDLVYN